MEQNARLNNVEVQGIEEKPGENLFQVVKDIANCISFDMNDGKIKHVHRVQSKNPGIKTKSILHLFRDRKNKENFMAAAKQKRMKKDGGSAKMRIADLSDGFFINEHLTLTDKISYKETRSVAKSKLYKYTWVKNSSIFVRKDDTSRVLHVYLVRCKPLQQMIICQLYRSPR